MISKKTFVDTMEALENLDQKMNAVDNAMKGLDLDFCGFYVTGIFDITINALADAFNDEEEWLSYFVYERDWLKKFELGDVIIGGEPLKINDWADVYDFLIKNMKE